jgi:hypothetical protein
MMNDADRAARRAARRAAQDALAASLATNVDGCTCKVCGKSYDRAAFLALSLPAFGQSDGSGLIFRNCSCDGTLVLSAI